MFGHGMVQFYDLSEDRRIISLAIAGINAICLIIVIPVFYFQLRICCGNRENRARAQSKVSVPERLMDKSIVELSDTPSMFVRPSEEWNPQSVSNQVSFLTPKIGAMNNPSCCMQNTKAIY